MTFPKKKKQFGMVGQCLLNLRLPWQPNFDKSFFSEMEMFLFPDSVRGDYEPQLCFYRRPWNAMKLVDFFRNLSGNNLTRSVPFLYFFTISFMFLAHISFLLVVLITFRLALALS